MIVQNLNLVRVTIETEINFCGQGDKTAIIYDVNRDPRSLGPSKLCYISTWLPLRFVMGVYSAFFAFVTNLNALSHKE